jgi:hypothetical protein
MKSYLSVQPIVGLHWGASYAPVGALCCTALSALRCSQLTQRQASPLPPTSSQTSKHKTSLIHSNLPKKPYSHSNKNKHASQQQLHAITIPLHVPPQRNPPHDLRTPPPTRRTHTHTRATAPPRPFPPTHSPHADVFGAAAPCVAHHPLRSLLDRAKGRKGVDLISSGARYW